MAFKFIERIGIQWQSMLQSLMTDLDSIDGWTIYSNKLSGSGGYFVMQLLTEDGVGNELYVKVSNNNNTIIFAVGELWDNVANAWANNKHITDQYWYGGSTPTATELHNYRISGDNNYMIFTAYTQANGTKMSPIYVGLLQKYAPYDTQPYAAVLLGRYWHNGNGLHWDAYNKCPILRSGAGNFNQYGLVMKETPFLRGGATEEFLKFGPWGPDKLIFSGAMSVYEDSWGIRGYLRGVRSVSGGNGTSVGFWETVLVNGDEYYWWKNTDTDATVSRASAWNLYDEDASGTSHKHGLLIRKTASAQ